MVYFAEDWQAHRYSKTLLVDRRGEVNHESPEGTAGCLKANEITKFKQCDYRHITASGHSVYRCLRRNRHPCLPFALYTVLLTEDQYEILVLYPKICAMRANAMLRYLCSALLQKGLPMTNQTPGLVDGIMLLVTSRTCCPIEVVRQKMKKRCNNQAYAATKRIDTKKESK